MTTNKPPVIDYEGSDYQTRFWDRGGREYEDRVERVAIKRLLPDQGELLLEVGAGAGRNTPRYQGYDRVVLLDYSLTQLQQAQEALGRSQKYLYVAGDAYRLPFVNELFDGVTMIRTLHHMQEPASALEEIQRVTQAGQPFILEFANKQNLKAIFRFVLGKQDWDPFSLEAVEFTKLNFDFHPQAVRAWLKQAGFTIERQLSVSYFRLNLLKKIIPTRLLVFLDSLVQGTGNWWQLSPSVFLRCTAAGSSPAPAPDAFFRCPDCGAGLGAGDGSTILCPRCDASYPIVDGIYDFRGE